MWAWATANQRQIREDSAPGRDLSENRIPHSLFEGLPNGDTRNSATGEAIPPPPVSLASGYDLDHARASFINLYDDGKMDGADKIRVICTNDPKAWQLPPANARFRYVNPSDVAPYFQMAKDDTFVDRMLQTDQGPSFPADQFIIADTPAPTATSDLFAWSNPGGVANASSMTACNA